MKTYTTAQGDLWDTIAYKQMGNSNYVDKLITANIQYCHYYRFPAGIVLTIPDIPEVTPESVPPWKR